MEAKANASKYLGESLIQSKYSLIPTGYLLPEIGL